MEVVFHYEVKLTMLRLAAGVQLEIATGVAWLVMNVTPIRIDSFARDAGGIISSANQDRITQCAQCAPAQ